MKEFTLKEYTQEEYEADMKKMLSEKGLYGAVKHFCDEINETTSLMGYMNHRSVQEWLCDILYLIKLQEGSKEKK